MVAATGSPWTLAPDRLRLSKMTIRQNLRTALALLAAYVVALYPVLFAVAIPAIGAADSFDQPICSTLHAADQAPGVPAGHRHDCLTACLAACCGASAPTLATTNAAHTGWGNGRSFELSPTNSQAMQSVIANAYRSRAPPPV
jgi:hypothetical protein